MHTVRDYRWNHTASSSRLCVYEASKPKLLPRKLEFKKDGKLIRMFADGKEITYLVQFRLLPIDTNTFRAVSRYHPKTVKFCIRVNTQNKMGNFICKNSYEFIKKFFKTKEV